MLLASSLSHMHLPAALRLGLEAFSHHFLKALQLLRAGEGRRQGGREAGRQGGEGGRRLFGRKG